MNYEVIAAKIKQALQKDPGDSSAYLDLQSVCRQLEPTDFDRAHRLNRELRAIATDTLRRGGTAAENAYEAYKASLLFDAPHYLDSYMLYLELNRPPKERFYAPRRKVLKKAVDALQRLADDELDELFLSQPPRTGKTTLLMFLVTWIVGRDSEMSNLYSAYSDVITSAFYSGVLEVIQDPNTYLWADVFPGKRIVSTNAKDETLNIDRRKRYPSLTCRSLYGTLNGACDCNGFEISDDLIGGIEEALNKDRLVSAWTKVDNNLLPRAKETAKILWCGTRWSLIDPAGLRMDLLENDERFKNRRFEVINLPALDGQDESNFNYDYGVGFSTDYYHQRRASFERNNDMASWLAQYMGQPIERSGTLFAPEELRYYNGTLPDMEPDRIFMAVDPAWGGGDYVAGPVCYQFGEDIYVHDVIYDNGDKKITQPLLVDKLIKHSVQALEIEATRATVSYKEGVEERLRAKGVKMNMTTRAAPTNKAKDQRIFDKAPDIRESMIFRESGKRSKDYELFMQNVFSYKITGKNKNDDAPDSLTMAMNMVRGKSNQIEIFKRPW